MRPISEIAAMVAQPWAASQVEIIRAKILELSLAINRLIYLFDSTAIKVFSGEQRLTPVLPRGMTSYTFAATATAEEVAHGLERVPTGYLVIRAYPQAAVMVADAARADWNAKTIWLQGEAGLTVTLVFF